MSEKTGNDRFETVSFLNISFFLRVVTGLRFVEENNIIHLQVQEGELLPGASIRSNTTKWVPLQLNHQDLTKDYLHKEDFVRLSFENTKINFGDTSYKSDYIVTGKIKIICSE